MMPVAVILCIAVLYWQHSQQLETYLKDTAAPAGKALFLQSPTSTATGKPLTILLIGVHDICTFHPTPYVRNNWELLCTAIRPILSANCRYK